MGRRHVAPPQSLRTRDRNIRKATPTFIEVLNLSIGEHVVQDQTSCTLRVRHHEHRNTIKPAACCRGRGAMATRRAHNKSRLGCHQCKKRRIKVSATLLITKHGCVNKRTLKDLRYTGDLTETSLRRSIAYKLLQAFPLKHSGSLPSMNARYRFGSKWFKTQNLRAIAASEYSQSY